MGDQQEWLDSQNDFLRAFAKCTSVYFYGYLPGYLFDTKIQFLFDRKV